MAGQFDFQQSSSPLLAALTQAPQERQKMQLLQEQARQARFNNFLNTLTTGASLARQIQQIQAGNLEQSQAKSQMEGQKNLQGILNEPAQTAPVSKFQFGPTQTPGPVVQPISQQPLSFGQTMQGGTQPQRLSAALLQANPSAVTGAMAGNMFPKPPTSVDALIAQNLSKGIDPQAAIDAKVAEKGPGSIQAKGILLNNRPMMANFQGGDYFDPVTKEKLTGDIKPNAQWSPMAEVRRASLVNTMNQKLPELVNPARFGPNTVAGKAANIVQNADSFLGQADNVINGHVVADKQVMTTLGIDGARALTQSGVVSEKIINDLVPQSARGKFADWQSWFKSDPTGREQLGFVKNLSTEIRRQRDQKQAIIDRTIGGNLASLNELKRLSPKDWEEGLEQNGLDVQAARKGKFKLRPEILSSLYGESEMSGVTQNQAEKEAAAYLGGQ